METLFLFLLCVRVTVCQWNWVWEPGYSYEMSRQNANATFIITNLTSDLIKDTDVKIRAIENIRLDNFRTASFEIGFLNYVIVEEYRKMIDKYNTTISMGGTLWAYETMEYLYDIEMQYWQIDHLCNMQHEIERKYKITTGLNDTPTLSELMEITEDPNSKIKKTRKTRDRLGEQIDAMVNKLQTPKKESTRWWWPKEYGWEIEYYW